MRRKPGRPLPRRRLSLVSGHLVNGRRSRSRATVRRAAVDAVAASWTIGSEVDGSCRTGAACGARDGSVPGRLWPGVRRAGVPNAEPGTDAGPAARGAASRDVQIVLTNWSARGEARPPIAGNPAPPAPTVLQITMDASADRVLTCGSADSCCRSCAAHPMDIPHALGLRCVKSAPHGFGSPVARVQPPAAPGSSVLMQAR